MILDPCSIAFISIPGGWEWLLIALLGLLFFGKRLPEVGKSLGKSIVEFKKGLKGIEDDIDHAVERDEKDVLPPPNGKESNADQNQAADSGEPVANTHSGKTS